VLDFLETRPLSGRGEEVREFYERRPFPGYAEGDDASSVIDRGRSSPYLAALDAAISPTATVLDCGCGTAQVATFLALSGPHRRVFGLDGCRASLGEADRFRARAGIRNLTLLRGDLFAPPLARGAFDIVQCRGVVHHTSDPDQATRSVASLVAPGGVLLLGIYESMARFPHRLRRGLGRVHFPLARSLDPVLRRRDLTESKKDTWIEDQYRHPLEQLMPVPASVALLDGLGFGWVRTLPPASENGAMFEPETRPSPVGLWLRRLGWLMRGLGDQDAGLICYVARRRGPGASA
jgi:SAM-dependent methyltransferase